MRVTQRLFLDTLRHLDVPILLLFPSFITIVSYLYLKSKKIWKHT